MQSFMAFKKKCFCVNDAFPVNAYSFYAYTYTHHTHINTFLRLKYLFKIDFVYEAFITPSRQN